jgi:RNA polymerase sigma factor for flagellar operon FliA
LIDLFRKYRKTHDVTIRNEIVLLYMDTVRFSALALRNLYAKGFDVEDFVNEGVIALIKAVETFDSERGVKFETYATLKIRGAIIDYIRKQDWIPRPVRQFARELDTAFGVLYHRLDRQPTNTELAEYMGLTEEQFAKRLGDTAGANTLSFEELLYEDNFGTGNADYADRELYAREQKAVIAQAIAELKPQEQKVISLYYYEKLKLREIAEVLGVTEGRVSQIHSKCMLVLKAKLENYIRG